MQGRTLSLLPFPVWVIAPIPGFVALMILAVRKWKEAAFDKICKIRLQRARDLEKKKDELLFLKCTNMIRAKQFYLNGKYSLEELAEDVQSNKSYISKAINTQAGMTYPQYLNKLRVEYALTLMKKDPHMPLSDVALLSGFSHQSAFSDSFKKNVGVSPRSYLDSVMYLRDATVFVDSEPQIVECPSMMKVEEQPNLSRFS